jgi:predicted alpha-1,2-mannosidase
LIKQLKTFACLTMALMITWHANAQLNSDTNPPGETDYSAYVDPTIGNVGHLLQPTRPTVQLPNQMMRMYPLRGDYIDDQITGFPLIIVSHRLGEAFSIKPVSATVSADSWKKKMPYDHDLEITRPWYYSTYLLNDETTIEYTAGKKTGVYRFTFSPQATIKALLFNTINNGAGDLRFNNGDEITGTEIYHGDIKVYLYGRLSEKGTPGILTNNVLSNGSNVAGKDSKAYISFPNGSPVTIEFRYAISYVSAGQAKRNFEAELTARSFDDLKTAGQEAWSSVINQVKVEGGTDAQKRSFYTALYRCYERMVDITEEGKYYSGFDNKIHSTTRPFYVDDWTWDTYLAHHPLRTILDPSKENDMLNSYVSMYEQSGWMPTFPVLFGDHACMNGFHSSIMFLDAYRKGIRDYNVVKAYEGMYKNGTEATMLPWRNGAKTDIDDVYLTKGYFPALKPGEAETNTVVHPFERRQAVAVTLGGSYDDWAVAQMAKELGKKDDYTKFSARAYNYKNLWNNKAQLFIPKDAKGDWITIDPKFDGGKGGRDYYDENNGWTYMWQVQQDLPGLISLMGGKAGFEAKLDQLFREPLGRSKHDMWYKFPDATGLVGQYSMGNEPSFHIPYLYNYTGSPWKTQQHIRFLLDLWFKDNVFGIPGDEDGGGMCAFVVFSSLGFYPLTPGNPVYTIGSPLFERSTIQLKNGKTFTVIADDCSKVNKYIQGATFNGQVLDTPWFTHDQLMAGGTLHLKMGPKPDKTWGTKSVK